MFAPDAKLVFAVDNSVDNFRGDQLLFASLKAALEKITRQRTCTPLPMSLSVRS